MGNWICKRCETANGDGVSACEVGNSLLLYTHEELEQVVVRRGNEIQAALTTAPAPVPVPATNCDGAWALALTFGLIALGLFVLLIVLLEMVTQ